MASAVSAVSAAPAIDSGRARMAENFDTFLTLLTTQLKNQDPLAPMDGNQFTQQMVQMTSVEQQLLTNDLLRSLVAQGDSGPSLDEALKLIGTTVTADQSTARLENDQAVWNYSLPRAAKEVTLEILNNRGVSVWQGEANDLEAGRHSLTWDGTVPGTGIRKPDGEYTLMVTAKDSVGEDVNARVNVQGTVTAAELINGETWLTVGGLRVPIGAVQGIRASS